MILLLVKLATGRGVCRGDCSVCRVILLLEGIGNTLAAKSITYEGVPRYFLANRLLIGECKLRSKTIAVLF